jgi:hypothetical protein
MTDEQASLYIRLRRLQEQNRSDLPGMMTQRAMRAFSLQQETAPEVPRHAVSVVVYPQDPFVSEPAVRQINAADIAPGLLNARFEIRDQSAALAKPDAQGNYLYWPGTPEFDQVNSLYYATFTLRMYERYAQRALPWSFPQPRLGIEPHAGDGANAFYSEQDRLLGFHSFTYAGETIHAAQSADVVSHETAHAVLDGMRDLMNESFGLGAAAFHESFGDMTAVLVALHDDSLVRRLLNWTDGNLRLDNFVTTVAEQLTERLQKRGENLHGRTIYLRNALNDFKAVPFDQLPAAPERPNTTLGRDSHNYSRLFTGAFYDALVGVYELMKLTLDERAAIHATRDILGNILTCAVEIGPVGELDFSDMAKAFLAADEILYDGKHSTILRLVFKQRGLLDTAAAEAWLDELHTLPAIEVPGTMQSTLDAALFLEEKVLPALPALKGLELTPMMAYRSGSGRVYLTYFTHRRTTLAGEQYGQFNGSHVDAFGGLTLSFDSTGRLRCAFLRPVTDDDVRQIHVLTADLIAQGLVAAGMGQGGGITPIQPLHLQPGNPLGLWLAHPPLLNAAPLPGAAKLVKYPVIFDALPGTLPDILTYLHALRQKLRL